MASGQHIRSHQLGNCWQEKYFLQTADVIGQNSLHILLTERKVQITVSWGRSDFVTFDRLRMFETPCLGLGGRVQAPCYSGRCPAEGARELPKERVHAGKSSSASAAGKGHLQSDSRSALEVCEQAGWLFRSCEQGFWMWTVCRRDVDTSFVGDHCVCTAKFSLKLLG